MWCRAMYKYHFVAKAVEPKRQALKQAEEELAITMEKLEKAQATLTGSAFDIELVSPAIQTISPVTENVWRWRVTPVATGMHELRIELFALENDEALPFRLRRREGLGAGAGTLAWGR